MGALTLEKHGKRKSVQPRVTNNSRGSKLDETFLSHSDESSSSEDLDE